MDRLTHSITGGQTAISRDEIRIRFGGTHFDYVVTSGGCTAECSRSYASGHECLAVARLAASERGLPGVLASQTVARAITRQVFGALAPVMEVQNA